MSPVNSTIVLFCYITVNLKYNYYYYYEPLHHSLGDLNQGQGVQSGLEINDEFLIHSNQLILRKHFQILFQKLNRMESWYEARKIWPNYEMFLDASASLGLGVSNMDKVEKIWQYFKIFQKDINVSELL